ncbi:MAG: hypothetical protein JSS49_05215 [Planctomycetes bacterium]|nr:hypothetical protein [Planctomycetota bacterium]
MCRTRLLNTSLVCVVLAYQSTCVGSIVFRAQDSVSQKPANTPVRPTPQKPSEKPVPPAVPSVPVRPTPTVPPQSDVFQNDVLNLAPLQNTLPNLASNSNASAIPNFIGDFGPLNANIMNAGNMNGTLLVPSPDADRQKLAENASPLPRDRVYLNYNYFDQVPSTFGNQGVNRFSPGFEKTFFDQWASVEVRLPFTSQLSNSIDVNGVNSNQVQFGNVTTYLKGLLYASPEMALSTGLGVQLPTAGDTELFAMGQEVLKIANRSVHLMPFVAATYTPGSRFYAQGILQFDFDTNGNSVYTKPTSGPQLQLQGTMQDQSLLYASLSTGYWIYRAPNPNDRGLTGIAPTAELHYNTTLQSSDTVGNTFVPASQIANLNGIVGLNAVFGYNKYLTVGYCTPLGRADAQFNSELRVMFNYYFGGSTVNPRFSQVPGQ